MVKKARIIVSILVIVIIGILVIPMESDNSDEIVTTFDNSVPNVDNTVLSATDIELDQIIVDQAIQEYSIIENARVFTESDQSLVDQFLDESGLPSSSEKFGIEVQTVLFDSAQNQYPESSILDIPELSVTDEFGRVLDLGSIQTSFLGITTDSNRGSETQFNLQGTVNFYLDDDLVAEKKLFASESGSAESYELFIVDPFSSTSIPTTFDRPKAFTFTLSDEGRDWEDQSFHTYRVVVTDIDAEIISNKDRKYFSWNGQEVVYELKVKVNENKKVVIDGFNQAIEVFKNDSTIQLCGKSSVEEIRYKGWVREVTDVPTVTVTNAYSSILVPQQNEPDWNGKSYIEFEPTLADIPRFKGKHLFDTVTVKDSCSEKYSGIPRDTDIVIEVVDSINGRSFYEVHTPKSQFNYYLDQSWGSATSNFGYENDGSGQKNPFRCYVVNDTLMNRGSCPQAIQDRY